MNWMAREPMKRAFHRIALLLLVCLSGWNPVAAQGQPRDALAELDVLGNWRESTIWMRDTGGLPFDSDFTAPLAVAYNWAYDAYLLGINAHVPNSSTSYATVAVEQGDDLDVMTLVGPLTGPAQWHAGPWHVAAGLPDGRLIAWLTAPSEYPRQLLLANDYVPGSAFEVQVTPPDPANNEWSKWSVTYVYEYGANQPYLTVAYMNGLGAPQGYLDGIGLGTKLASVAYYAGMEESAAPLLFFTYELLGGDGRGRGMWASQYAWHTAKGWVVHDTGAPQSAYSRIVLDPRGAGAAVLVWGDTELPDTASLMLMNGLTANPDFLSNRYSEVARFPVLPVAHGLAVFQSALSSYPMVALSGSADIYLGWQSGGGASGFGYYYTKLKSGETYQRSGQYYPRYPIQGLAATADWDSGNPRIYWVQQGSMDGTGGALFRLSYEPAR